MNVFSVQQMLHLECCPISDMNCPVISTSRQYQLSIGHFLPVYWCHCCCMTSQSFHFLSCLGKESVNYNILYQTHDTVLYFSSKSSNVLQEKFNCDLENVCKWLKTNHLTTNIKKSKFMIIGSTQSLAKLSSTLVFSIEDVSLTTVFIRLTALGAY